ncbi:MAG: HEAT repeat domain-containing protein, partial [Pirellulaceae bacterium]
WLLSGVIIARAEDAPAASLDQLTQQMKEGSAELRLAAIEGLGRLGAGAAPAVDGLIALLDDPDSNIRIASAQALGAIGAPARRAVPALLKRFTDLERNEAEVPVWHAAGEAVGKLGPDSLPELMKLLVSEDDIACHAAAVAIHGLGAEAKAAVPAVIDQLRQKSTRRIPMIYALMGMGPAAADAVPVLIKMLDVEDDFHVQYWACRALGQVGLPAAQPAVKELVRLVRHPVASVRGNAAAALGKLGPQVGEEAIAALAAALKDKLYNVRRSAAIALGEMGPTAATAVPALDAGLAREGFAARSQAAVARWRITQEVEPSLVVLLSELQLRDGPWDAAEGFQQMGAEAAPAVDRLTKLFASPLSETRLFAASSLAGIGFPAKSALPQLRELTKDSDQDVREVAAEAIQTIEKAQQP